MRQVSLPQKASMTVESFRAFRRMTNQLREDERNREKEFKRAATEWLQKTACWFPVVIKIEAMRHLETFGA